MHLVFGVHNKGLHGLTGTHDANADAYARTRAHAHAQAHAHVCTHTHTHTYTHTHHFCHQTVWVLGREVRDAPFFGDLSHFGDPRPDNGEAEDLGEARGS